MFFKAMLNVFLFDIIKRNLNPFLLHFQENGFALVECLNHDHEACHNKRKRRFTLIWYLVA